MHTRALKTFLHIVRAGSFIRAADEMNTTLSTVSMQIRSLENNLRVILFDREFRPPRVTPLGQQIAEYAQEIIDAEKRLIAACEFTEELSGVFSIGFIATASVRLLPSFLAKARNSAPNASFRFETALSEVLEERVLSGHLEAAVVTASKAPPIGLVYTSLRSEQLVYAFPPGCYDQSIEMIEDQFSFLQFNPGSGIGKSIESLQRKKSKQPTNHTIVLDSVEAIMECVNQGLGFTLLAKPDVQRYASKGVTLVETEGSEFVRDVVLVTRESFEVKTRNLIADLFHILY